MRKNFHLRTGPTHINDDNYNIKLYSITITQVKIT